MLMLRVPFGELARLSDPQIMRGYDSYQVAMLDHRQRADLALTGDSYRML